MNNDNKGIAYGLGTALCAATYLTINRHVYLKYHPKAFAYSATFLIAAGVFALVSLLASNLNRSSRAKIKKPSLLLINGVLASIGLGLVAYGQNYTTAINASIIFAATTIPTVIFSKLILKDSLNQRQLSWMLLMFVGLYFAIVGAHVLSFSRGDLIILLATVFVGFTNTYSKIIMKYNNASVVSDSRLLVGGILFAGLGFIFSGKGFLVTEAGLWPWLAGLFLWLTIKSFYRAINLINPNKSTVLANSHPIITPFIGVILLDEPYSWIKALGSIILLISVYQITKK